MAAAKLWRLKRAQNCSKSYVTDVFVTSTPKIVIRYQYYQSKQNVPKKTLFLEMLTVIFINRLNTIGMIEEEETLAYVFYISFDKTR